MQILVSEVSHDRHKTASSQPRNAPWSRLTLNDNGSLRIQLSGLAVTNRATSALSPLHPHDRHRRPLSNQPALTNDVHRHPIDIAGAPPARRQTRRFRAGLRARATYRNTLLSKDKTKARDVQFNSSTRRREMNPTSGRALMINGRFGWTARRSRREQHHKVLLTTAFKSEGPERGAVAVYKSAHNHDRNEHTSAARITRGRELNSPILSQSID